MQPLFDPQSQGQPPGAAAQGPAPGPAAGQAPPPQAGPPNMADQPPPPPADPMAPAQAMGPLISPGDMESIRPTGKMPGTPEFNEEEPTELEQQQYDQFVGKAIDFMSQNTTEIMASMNNAQQPVHMNVASIAVKLGRGVYGMAKSAGEDIGMEVIHAAGAEIVEHLMELGVTSKIFPFTEESEEYEQIQAMALLEAEKIVGEELVKSPQYTAEMQEGAQNFYAQQVAGEVQRGESPENFHENIGNQVAGGVRKAIGG
jgi:hypothetical protein